MIFVFGSNEAGRHGAGAAKYARDNCGAIYGQGFGRQGNSFAIPTKDKNLKTLPIDQIEEYFRMFCDHAEATPDVTFALTPIGCGLAGYDKSVIWRMMQRVKLPKNVFLTYTWVHE
jgi:hypothetical protein